MKYVPQDNHPGSESACAAPVGEKTKKSATWRHKVTLVRDVLTVCAFFLYLLAILTPWWAKIGDLDLGLLHQCKYGECSEISIATYAGNMGKLVIDIEVYATMVLYVLLIGLMFLATTAWVRKFQLKSFMNWTLAIMRTLIGIVILAGLATFAVWLHDLHPDDSKFNHSFYMAVAAGLLSLVVAQLSFLKLLKQI